MNAFLALSIALGVCPSCNRKAATTNVKCVLAF